MSLKMIVFLKMIVLSMNYLASTAIIFGRVFWLASSLCAASFRRRALKSDAYQVAKALMMLGLQGQEVSAARFRQMPSS